MEVRKAIEQDIKELVELNRQIGQLHYENVPKVFTKPSQEEKEFLLDALRNAEGLFLVAEDKGKVVGFVTARITINETVPFLAKQPICRIGTVVVDQNNQFRGVGKALMDKCKEWAIGSGAVEIRLEVMNFNRQARDFYERLGYGVQSNIMAKHIS